LSRPGSSAPTAAPGLGSEPQPGLRRPGRRRCCRHGAQFPGLGSRLAAATQPGTDGPVLALGGFPRVVDGGDRAGGGLGGVVLQGEKRTSCPSGSCSPARPAPMTATCGRPGRRLPSARFWTVMALPRSAQPAARSCTTWPPACRSRRSPSPART
jgi:hypothetical protein